jgi:hypothetical protein
VFCRQFTLDSPHVSKVRFLLLLFLPLNFFVQLNTRNHLLGVLFVLLHFFPFRLLLLELLFILEDQVCFECVSSFLYGLFAQELELLVGQNWTCSRDLGANVLLLH